MIRYFMMKRNEWKVKTMLYGTIASVMDENKDVIGFIQRLYGALKDVPMENLRKELISNIAQLAHEQAAKEREAEKSA